MPKIRSDQIKDSQITEQKLSLSDVTTFDVNTSRHGFVPKAPGNTSLFLRGDGTWAVPPTGGGDAGALPTARTFGLGYYDDFLNSGSSPQTQRGQWLITLINSGTQSLQASTPDHPGIVRFFSSTTANSGARVITGLSALRLGGGESTEIVFRVINTAGTTVRMGFLDTTGNADATDGVYIEIVGTTLVGKTANNNTRSTTGTYTITANTWYRALIELTTGLIVANFYLFNENDGLLWSDYLDTNIPTSSGRETGHGIIATNSGTSAVALIDLDYMDLKINRVLNR